ERIAIPSLASARAAGAPEALSALLFRPAGAGPFAAMVALHGCGGLYTNRTRGTLDRRFADWGARLSALGYAVLFPDSFGPRRILVGDADNWSSPGPCRDIAAAARAQGAAVEFTLYPGANHDFDYPDLPLRVRANVAGTRSGTATLGTDPAARADALARVPAF